jgi:hypothetical protein
MPANVFLPEHPHPLIGEELLTVAAAAREFPSRNGGRASAATVWRWTVTGVRTRGGRVKLERIKIGAFFYTSREAIVRFLAALNEPADAPAATIKTAGQRERDAKRANQRAERAGRELERRGF